MTSLQRVTFSLFTAARDLFRFSVDMGKIALQIAEKHGTASEIWFVHLSGGRRPLLTSFSRAQVLFCSMVSGFDSTHVRSNVARLDAACKYGASSGDRVYTGKCEL